MTLRFMDQYLPAFGSNWALFLLWGILLVALGCFAIVAATTATMLSIIVLGFVIFFSGAVMLVDTTSFWWGRWAGFFIHLIISLLYLLVGLTLIFNPVESSISITFLLGVFYLIVGIFRIFYSIGLQTPRWGWALFNGIITLVLGILILASWPASSLFIIGLFVGIDLIFVGWAYVMASLAGKSIAHQLR